MSQNDTPDERALLPCPFCGGTDLSMEDAREFISCLTCHTEGPFFAGDAIEKWNTRAARAHPLSPAETAEPPALTDEQGKAALTLLKRIRYHAKRHDLDREWLTAADDVLGTWGPVSTASTDALTPPPEQASTPKIKELPGMWSRTDFEGGDPDTRSYAERARQASTPRAEPAAYMYSHDESTRTTFRMPDERMNERRWHETPLYTLPPNTAPDEATAVAALRELVACKDESMPAASAGTDAMCDFYDRRSNAWEAARRVLGGNPAAVSVEGLGVDARGFDVHPAEPSGSSHGSDGAGDDRGRVVWANQDELDAMLNDRTATISGVRDGWRKTPLYRGSE